jgi:hypothetical protein
MYRNDTNKGTLDGWVRCSLADKVSVFYDTIVQMSRVTQSTTWCPLCLLLRLPQYLPYPPQQAVLP